MLRTPSLQNTQVGLCTGAQSESLFLHLPSVQAMHTIFGSFEDRGLPAEEAPERSGASDDERLRSPLPRPLVLPFVLPFSLPLGAGRRKRCSSGCSQEQASPLLQCPFVFHVLHVESFLCSCTGA